MGEVIQIRDFQTIDERLNRWVREVDRVIKDAMEGSPLIDESVPYGGQGIDGMELGKEPA